MRRTKQVALVPVTEFPDRLMRERFDIALAPLAANPFNEARSNLKFLEYSLAGAATVASAVGPFSDGRLLWCASTTGPTTGSPPFGG